MFPEDEEDDAWLVKVDDDGPAAKAGLKPGDTITKFDGEQVKTVKRVPRDHQGQEARRHGEDDRPPRRRDSHAHDHPRQEAGRQVKPTGFGPPAEREAANPTAQPSPYPERGGLLIPCDTFPTGVYDR